MIYNRMVSIVSSLLLLLLGSAFAFLPPAGVRVPRQGIAATAATSKTTSLDAAQILDFREPTTGVRVVLIGAMHYNPASVQLAKQTIEDLGRENNLGSVVVEACDVRWNKTSELYKEKPLLKKFLNNEMRAACDTALSFDRPVVLGDQRINATVDALKSSFQDTLKDIASPPVGWVRFAEEIQAAWKETLPFGGKGYLSAFAFFDPRLLFVLPVSLVKYPLSYLVRDPLPTTLGLGLLGALTIFEDPNTLDSLVVDDAVTWTEAILSLFFAFFETVVFARLLLKPLLAERNVILAESILEQCKYYSSNQVSAVNKQQSPFAWFKWGQKSESAVDGSGIETTYVPGSPLPIAGDRDKVVVAVLGMAHCNGIKRILCEGTRSGQ